MTHPHDTPLLSIHQSTPLPYSTRTASNQRPVILQAVNKTAVAADGSLDCSAGFDIITSASESVLPLLRGYSEVVLTQMMQLCVRTVIYDSSL